MKQTGQDFSWRKLVMGEYPAKLGSGNAANRNTGLLKQVCDKRLSAFLAQVLKANSSLPNSPII